MLALKYDGETEMDAIIRFEYLVLVAALLAGLIAGLAL
jgi:hypothetical protein